MHMIYEAPKTTWMGLGNFLLEISKCPPNSHLNPAIDARQLCDRCCILYLNLARVPALLTVFYRTLTVIV